ncbi:LacI family DNA-binding transcriptional regulator [Trueperella bialowiezensis]|uniref:HTH-type transcriptional repressor CytR n=1 Tax=Trueperella bialowiezensis TaxID=312285 RepID=A0A3S4V7K8_9ACTO|nr:LacI family DNA-binding transcriptional regulator [Trueperella bialowiezensis]VEI13778.1 HTH-type transcriptional repressor CytR [Trueperella bialowiezensis]
MAHRIRLADIAAQAGVSTATVSRVLNAKSSVAPKTRQAVVAALDLLGYERPKTLREHGGGLVGMIVPELTNPIFPFFTQSIVSALSLQGYTPLLGTQMAGGTTEDSYVETMLAHRVAGFVFVSGLHADSTANISRYERIIARKIPFVTINGAHPGLRNPDFSTDDADAIRQAVCHLTSLGHQKIGFASGPLRFIPSLHKTEAFIDAMRHSHPHEQPRVVHTLYTVNGGAGAAAQLIGAGCTAIICGSDMMALGAVRHCKAAGISVPSDISIVGFDDSPVTGFSDPPLTTLRQPVKAITEAAVSTLVALIKGMQVDIGKMSFDPELIVRGSTAARK